MYGYDLIEEYESEEIKLGDLWATYMAADKYLVEELKEGLIVSSVSRLNRFTACILFDQFLKMPFEKIGSFVFKEKEAILNEFKKTIQAHSKAAFESESFLAIEADTLIQILRFEFLNLPELDVLKACLRWMNAEIVRLGLVPVAENKRKVFSSIKSFVRFTDLRDKELSDLSELKEVLSPDEYASLFLRLTGKCDQIAIKYKNERKVGRKVYEVKNNEFFSGGIIVNTTGKLRANKKVCITFIETSLPSRAENLKFRIFKEEQGEFVPLPFLESAPYLCNENWCLELERAFEIDPDLDYKFSLEFSYGKRGYSSKGSSFVTDDGQNKFELTLSDFGNYHCISGFNFCELSNFESAKSI